MGSSTDPAEILANLTPDLSNSGMYHAKTPFGEALSLQIDGSIEFQSWLVLVILEGKIAQK